MAYAAVASLLQTVDIFLDYHQHSISLQFNDQITSVHKHACSLHTFLEEGSSDRVNNWEETIREVTDRAEQIIELLLSDLLLKKSGVGSSKPESEKRKKYEVHYSYDELEKVAEEIESIAIRVLKTRRHDTTTVNFDDIEVMEMVSRLLGGSASLEVIAICGSGGMGKTTLAKSAYFHPLIDEHFDTRAWSQVPREYTRGFVIRNLLRTMKAEYSTSNSEDELIRRLSQALTRRRYRIVLDDVRSSEVLEMLKTILPDDGNGSRIIYTARSLDLAKSAHHVHEMRLLDEEKSWSLVRERIFKGDPCPFQLESIGKSIARSCGGNRLSIQVVSGILAASDPSEAAWEDVLDKIKIASDKIDEILYLGYMYLPHHLRPCLLFPVVYPEGRLLYVSELIRLWVAEGFLNESGYKSLEETGEEYVEDLVNRSLVNIYRRKSNGRIKGIKVHDLIRGMCLRQARMDNFSLPFDGARLKGKKELIKTCRRVSDLNDPQDFLSGVYGSTIRTLIFCLEQSGTLDVRCWIGNVKLLRILDLSNVNNYSLSARVYELFHLRYLAFHCDICFPEAISSLQNLQTLIIYHVTKGGVFDKLPEGIWRMPQLRHLRVFSFKFSYKKGPTPVALENLETLLQVVDFVCSRESLKMFPNVKKLALVYTKNWRDAMEDYELHNLTYMLQKLETLKIRTSLSTREEVHKMMSYATFPPTLKKLSLHGLQLSWEDMKIVGSLPNLEVLKLRNRACAGKTWETSEGGFSRLVYLLIEESDLEKWIMKSSSHFPRLWRLVLVRCSSLLEVPYEMAEVPALRHIYLDDTNHPLWRSAQRIREDRHSLGHDPIHVRLL